MIHAEPVPIPAAGRYRVTLLEASPFLREVYGQEVRDWAELRARPLELATVDDPAVWLADLGRRQPALGIVDVDGLGVNALDLHRQARAAASAAEMPLIMLGSPTSLALVSAVRDDRLRCLSKPLRFGDLMNTVRALVGEPGAIRNESHRG